MFTGIIEKTAEIHSVERVGESFRLEIDTGFTDLALGESVAVNGVCLTVQSLSSVSRAQGSGASGYAWFDIALETRRRSHLGKLEAGDSVNLERALLPTTRLSGHWVQGHVDGLATFIRAVSEGDGYYLDFDLPEVLSKYCVEKGSIALNGISLTIGSIRPSHEGSVTLRVYIVPHTWTHTTLRLLESGHQVNIEVDVLAKYVERLLIHRQ